MFSARILFLILIFSGTVEAQPHGLFVTVHSGYPAYELADRLAEQISRVNPTLLLSQLDWDQNRNVLRRAGSKYGPGTKFSLIVVSLPASATWAEAKLLLHLYVRRLREDTRIVLLSGSSQIRDQVQSSRTVEDFMAQLKISPAAFHFEATPHLESLDAYLTLGDRVQDAARSALGGMGLSLSVLNSGDVHFWLESGLSLALLTVSAELVRVLGRQTQAGIRRTQLNSVLWSPVAGYLLLHQVAPTDVESYLLAVAGAPAAHRWMIFVEDLLNSSAQARPRLVWPSATGSLAFNYDRAKIFACAAELSRTE